MTNTDGIARDELAAWNTPDEVEGPAATLASSATAGSSIPDITRAIVQEFLAARLAGDTERLVALFADEVDWQLAENPAAPWIRPRSTAAQCAAQFEELMEHTMPEDARASVGTFLVDGTDAVLMDIYQARYGRLVSPLRAHSHCVLQYRTAGSFDTTCTRREQPVDCRSLRPVRLSCGAGTVPLSGPEPTVTY